MGENTANGSKRAFGLSLFLLAGLPAASPGASLDKVLEDAPGRLILEVDVPFFKVSGADGGGGGRVVCPGCQSVDRPGAPDLPVHRFTVLTGPSAPKVSLAILESETRVLGGGIVPSPHYLTPFQPEFRRDEAAFARAASAEARLFEAHWQRGAPTRGIEIPLALWNEGPHTLTLIKRIRVVVEFPGLLSRPAPAIAGPLRREVRNPAGGAWLYAPRRIPRVMSVGSGGRALAKGAAPEKTAVLGKAAAPGKAALPIVTSVGDTLLRFKIRNKSPESFAEDRYYAIAYASLPPDLSRIMHGRKLAWMRLLTGINDTLPMAIDSTGAVPGRLHEIPMEAVDADGDSTFSQGDSLKFFAHGTNIWKRNEDPRTAIRYEFSNDPYSFENSYYLDFGIPGREGLRLKAEPTPPPSGTPLASSYSFLRAEKDLGVAACDPTHFKDMETGPDWHWKWKGDCHGDPDLEMTAGDLASEETAAMPNKAGDTVLIGLYTYPKGASFSVIFKGKQLGPLPDSVLPGTWYDSSSAGYWFHWEGSLPGSAPMVPDKVIWRGASPRFEGYTLLYRRAHILPSGQNAWIFPPETGKPVSYRVQGGEGAFCARIVDGEAHALLVLDGNGIFTDSLPPGANARYLLFRSASAPPSNALDLEILPRGAPKGPIRNLADCDGLPDGQLPEYLIVTGRSLVEQAMLLKDYRDSAGRAYRARPMVVTVEDIYRQYSGGRLSPAAIRDFLRYAYSGWGRGPSAEGILKHVVLFGDGNFDYRNLTTGHGLASNIIPPFEYLPVHPGGPAALAEQLATDDFYAMFEPGPERLEGGALSLAIGRVPVQTAQEAAGYLAKIRAYEDPRKAGEWRAHVVLAADDNLQRGNKDNLDLIPGGHTTDSDDLGKIIQANEKGTSLDKIYLLDYPLNSAFHKPQAAQDLLTQINRGAVVINYVGHGASNQWADEVLLQTNDAVARMRNEGRAGMVNAFSCTVGRFESLTSEGMSEQFVKENGVGAIGAVSATRESYPGPNLTLARAFYARAFPPDSSGGLATVGEALQFAKNSTVTSEINNLKYALLGEPVLMLRKAKLELELSQVMDTIRALDCGTLRGRVKGGTGNGKVNLKVLAGSIQRAYTNLGSASVTLEDQHAEKRGNVLFDVTVPYKHGEFSADYFIPKQISFGDTNAQVLAFAWDDSLEREGTTARRDLRIKGTSTSSCAIDSDGKGPRIRISGCERKETGGLDFPEKVKLSLPYCLQFDVMDSSGGVISAEGPDEGTTVEIPGSLDPFHPQPGIDDLFHKTYQLTLDAKTIRPGNHLLKVSARDGYGNYSARQLQMDISLDSALVSIHAYNHPNPMKRNGTTFYFSTGMPQEELEYGDNPDAGKPRLAYEVRIFNQAGRLVRVLREAVSGETRWDGRDQWGNQLANGVYFYKVTATQVLFAYDDRPGYSTVTSEYNTLVLSR